MNCAIAHGVKCLLTAPNHLIFCILHRHNGWTYRLQIWYIDLQQQAPLCRWKIFPERGVVWVSWPVLEFYTPCKISATANARDLVHGSAMRSLSIVTSVFPKWTWSGSREQLLHCGLRKFCHSKSWYSGDIHNSTVVGLFMTPIRQWKRLARVTVECTCLLHIGPPTS